MTIITAPVKKTNGKASSTEEKAVVAAMKTVLIPEVTKTEEKVLVAKVEPEKPVILAPEPKKEIINGAIFISKLKINKGLNS